MASRPSAETTSLDLGQVDPSTKLARPNREGAPRAFDTPCPRRGYMSDIPLRTFGRLRNSRSGYTPLNTEQDEYDADGNGSVSGNSHQTMPLQATATKAAVSAASQNHQRWKGKKKQSYQDDPEEHEGLLGDDEDRDSEDGVGRAGPARIPTQEVRLTTVLPYCISHRTAIALAVEFQ
jgi:hypothetical protein